MQSLWKQSASNGGLGNIFVLLRKQRHGGGSSQEKPVFQTTQTVTLIYPPEDAPTGSEIQGEKN